MLPTQDYMRLKDTFDNLQHRRIGVTHLALKPIKEEIKTQLFEEFVAYISPHLGEINRLQALGLINVQHSDYDTFELKNGFDYNYTVLEERLKTKFPQFSSMIRTIKFSAPLEDRLAYIALQYANLGNQYEEAHSLRKRVKTQYGTVRYMLTQFPELAAIFPNACSRDWKPNPHYKIPPRSSFENPDAFVVFLGGCAMDGVKP